jgi:hypothetical protein
MYQFDIRVGMDRMSQSRQAGRVVSEHYTTVSMVRTTEEVLRSACTMPWPSR